MHKIIGIMLLISLCGLMSGSSVGAVAQVAQTPGTGTISGRVTEADGTTPISGASVYLTTPGGISERTNDTNATGHYEFLDVPHGVYAARVYHLGYYQEYYDNERTFPMATLVSLLPDLPAPILNFMLDKKGVITGKVTEADGTTPISGAMINVFQLDGTLVWYLTTRADGTYTTLGVGSGDYVVLASKPDYMTEFYDGQSTQTDATPVTVPLNTIIPNIDFALTYTLRNSVIGTVTEADGVTPIAGATVWVKSASGSFYGGVPSGPDGQYRIEQLPSGSYTAHAVKNHYVAEYYDNQSDYQMGTPITVSDDVTTENINFSLDLGGSITGRITQIDGITPIRSVYITATQIDGMNIGYKYAAGGYSAADGSYSITGLPSGTYALEARNYSYATEYYDDQAGESTATPVTVALATTTPDINFSLDALGILRGKVTQVDGVTPINGVGVTVRSIDSDYYVYGSTTADGTYTVNSIRPGNYIVYANNVPFGSKYYDNQRTSVGASSFTIGLNSIIENINFALEAGGAITGTVTEVDGTPISNARVRILTIDGVTRSSSTMTTSVGTAGDGTYTLAGLPTGSYAIRVETGRHRPQTFEPSIAVIAGEVTPNINFSLTSLITHGG